MASPSTPVHPARYLAIFLALLVGVYLLVFLTGDKKTEPKLGIDLQGGTRVTLTARTPDGSRPTQDALNQAQQIISSRVNGLGVSGSEVVIDGDNLVITVPGNDSSEARNLGQTARLYIRPVIHAIAAGPAGAAARRAPAGPAQGGAAGRPAGRRPHRACPPRRRRRRRPPRGGAAHGAREQGGVPAAPAPRRRRRRPRPQPRPDPPRRRRRARRRPRRGPPRRPAARTSRSASPTRRRCGRAPSSRSRSWRCSSRRPAATRTTSSQATTIRTCPW